MARVTKPKQVEPVGPRLVRKPDRRTTSTPPPFTPSYEQIAIRAYELFIVEGGAHGRHVDHWLRAERELMESEATVRPSRRAAGARTKE